MNTALWIVGALLAVAFLATGLMKLTRTRAQLQAAGQGWVEDFGDTAVKGIRAIEVAAAVALVVPALVDTETVLVPLAAVGLVLMMVGAAITYARRREYPNIGANVVLLELALFVAIGRFGSHEAGPANDLRPLVHDTPCGRRRGVDRRELAFSAPGR